MPELSIEYVQVCSQEDYSENVPASKGTEVYDVHVTRSGTGDNCTCPGFTFRRNCKHVKAAHEKLCNWQENLSDEQQTPQQEMEGICPKCGAETKVIRMGV